MKKKTLIKMKKVLTGNEDDDFWLLMDLSPGEIDQVCTNNKVVKYICNSDSFWKKRFMVKYHPIITLREAEVLKSDFDIETWRDFMDYFSKTMSSLEFEDAYDNLSKLKTNEQRSPGSIRLAPRKKGDKLAPLPPLTGSNLPRSPEPGKRLLAPLPYLPFEPNMVGSPGNERPFVPKKKVSNDKRDPLPPLPLGSSRLYSPPQMRK